MKLALPKGFWMMKLLNRNYPAPLRAIAASVGFCLTLLATGRLVLAQELASRCWIHDDFKLAARRGAWYFRRGWINLDVSQDEFFDVTESLTDRQLDTLQGFLNARAPKLPPVIHAADFALIAARRLDNNSIPDQREAHITQFKDACDALLSHTQTSLSMNTPPSKPRKGDFPIADAKQTLADFLALFPTTQLPWFLVSGTFLGLIRENGFLAHDYDIDLGVFEDEIDIQAVRVAILASDKFVLKKYDHHKSTLFQAKTASKNADVPYILKIIHVSGIHIDLFIHYRDTTQTPAIYWHGSSLHRWENSAFALKSYDFYDHQVLGPADADTYLTENYGDWRTPVTEFNCTTDTPNLALVPHPIAVVIFIRRYVLNKAHDPVAADKLKAELIDNGFVRVAQNDELSFSGDLFAA